MPITPGKITCAYDYLSNKCNLGSHGTSIKTLHVRRNLEKSTDRTKCFTYHSSLTQTDSSNPLLSITLVPQTPTSFHLVSLSLSLSFFTAFTTYPKINLKRGFILVLIAHIDLVFFFYRLFSQRFRIIQKAFFLLRIALAYHAAGHIETGNSSIYFVCSLNKPKKPIW